MKPYILSICVGVLVGVIYALVNVKSPAPPVIALLGLLGILIGEQAVPIARRLIAREPVMAYVRTDCAGQVLGPQAVRPAKPEQES
ncbi:DUF1427 family protein [Sphingomonas sp. CJ20]